MDGDGVRSRGMVLVRDAYITGDLGECNTLKSTLAISLHEPGHL